MRRPEEAALWRGMNVAVAVEVSVEASTGGGVHFWVLNAGGWGELTQTTRVTVDLGHDAFQQLEGVK